MQVEVEFESLNFAKRPQRFATAELRRRREVAALVVRKELPEALLFPTPGLHHAHRDLDGHPPGDRLTPYGRIVVSKGSAGSFDAPSYKVQVGASLQQ